MRPKKVDERQRARKRESEYRVLRVRLDVEAVSVCDSESLIDCDTPGNCTHKRTGSIVLLLQHFESINAYVFAVKTAPIRKLISEQVTATIFEVARRNSAQELGDGCLKGRPVVSSNL